MKKRWYGVLVGTAALAMAMGCAAGAEEGISGELNIMHYIAEASKLEGFDDIVEHCGSENRCLHIGGFGSCGVEKDVA